MVFRRSNMTFGQNVVAQTRRLVSEDLLLLFGITVS